MIYAACWLKGMKNETQLTYLTASARFSHLKICLFAPYKNSKLIKNNELKQNL